jgi:hypothetical protein
MFLDSIISKGFRIFSLFKSGYYVDAQIATRRRAAIPPVTEKDEFPRRPFGPEAVYQRSPIFVKKLVHFTSLSVSSWSPSKE